MITYEAIRRFVQEEERSAKPVKLPEGFFREAMVYLERKEKQTKGTGDAWQFENARLELRRLIDLRDKKILNLAFHFSRAGVEPEHLAPEEKEFFKAIVEDVESFRAKRTEILEKKAVQLEEVTILEDLPEFVGIDMKNYGPFKKGDVAKIPADNAKLLVKKKAAKGVAV